MKARPKKTVVLTSRENFVWLSMQEIIPLIESCWQKSAAPGRHEVICRNVDQVPIGELMQELLEADNIVFTCFTVRLCKLGELLRSQFGVEARYFIYLHNQATIFCWPFHAWGMGNHLREDDVFISTSTPDANTFKHSFVGGRVEIVPFTMPGLKSAYPVPRAKSSEIPFIYAGRLSAQKNIHTLIYAFQLLSEQRPDLSWKLVVYGKDDNLGSPNMGMSSLHYGDSLKALARQLGLEDRVVFKGYTKRSQLNRELAKYRHIAASASLHSDENFGMAQFRSLCHGNLAVLTRWGGYADFGTRFAKRAFLATVEETPKGPWVDPGQLARLLALAADTYRKPAPARVEVPGYYRENSIVGQLRQLATETWKPGAKLKLTPLARKILKKQERFGKGDSHSGRIFESYADPDARVPFRGYLMEGRRLSSAGSVLRCLPWVELGESSIRVSDPHRGDVTLPFRAGSVTLIDCSGKRRRVGAATAQALLTMGYSHAERDRK